MKHYHIYNNGLIEKRFSETDTIPKGFNLGGLKKSTEFREKISKATSGENNPMYGKKHTNEAKQLISLHCNNVGKCNPMYGKHHTEEAKLKMSEAAKK